MSAYQARTNWRRTCRDRQVAVARMSYFHLERANRKSVNVFVVRLRGDCGSLLFFRFAPYWSALPQDDHVAEFSFD